MPPWRSTKGCRISSSTCSAGRYNLGRDARRHSRDGLQGGHRRHPRLALVQAREGAPVPRGRGAVLGRIREGPDLHFEGSSWSTRAQVVIVGVPHTAYKTLAIPPASRSSISGACWRVPVSRAGGPGRRERIVKPIVSPEHAHPPPASIFEIGDYSIVDDFCYISTRVRIGICSHVASGCSIAGGPRTSSRSATSAACRPASRSGASATTSRTTSSASLPPGAKASKTRRLKATSRSAHYTAASARTPW